MVYNKLLHISIGQSFLIEIILSISCQYIIKLGKGPNFYDRTSGVNGYGSHSFTPCLEF